jgi:hypothetical protein
MGYKLDTTGRFPDLWMIIALTTALIIFRSTVRGPGPAAAQTYCQGHQHKYKGHAKRAGYLWKTACRELGHQRSGRFREGLKNISIIFEHGIFHGITTDAYN